MTDSKVVMMPPMGRRGEMCHLFKNITHCVEDSNFYVDRLVTIQVASEKPSISHLEALQEASPLFEKEREPWKPERLAL